MSASTPSDIFATDFVERPYWWDAAPPEEDLNALPAAVDVAIVGSGYAGLSAAAELARAGRSVVVLDADALGAGASTRSGGMVSSGQKLVVGGAMKGVDQALFARLIEDSIGSFEHLKALVDGEGLDADLKITGRFFGAHGTRAKKRLDDMGHALRTMTGATVHSVARQDQHSAIGSDYYHGGIVIDDYGGLHPGKYNRALRDLARRRGAILRSHARVLGIDDSGTGKTVRTARGDIKAGEVVITTNGYTDRKATPELARRLVPVKSYQIATEPLPPELLAELIPGARMVSDTRRDIIYTRPSPDGTRLLFGSRPGILDRPDREAALGLYKRMVEIWPQLEGRRITHAWSGFVAMTRDKVARMGTLDNGVFAAGCNGNGVALMTYLGHQTALKLLRRQNRPAAFDGLPLDAIPAYDGRPYFLPVVAGWYRALDAVDRRFDNPSR